MHYQVHAALGQVLPLKVPSSEGSHDPPLAGRCFITDWDGGVYMGPPPYEGLYGRAGPARPTYPYKFYT